MIVDLALAVAPAVFGGAVWRRHGASWIAILSWAIPVTVLLVAGLVYAGGASRIAMVIAGAVFFGAVMLSNRAAIWWERNVSRTMH
jgi:hypothetical protein